MAPTTRLHLKVTTDTADAIELAPRIKAAVATTLRRTAGIAITDETAGSVAAGVMTEILRIRQADPKEAQQAHAIERVLALHRQEYGSCAECTHESSVLWPCATVLAVAPGMEG